MNVNKGTTKMFNKNILVHKKIIYTTSSATYAQLPTFAADPSQSNQPNHPPSPQIEH